MNAGKRNIFDPIEGDPGDKEIFEPLAGSSSVLVERIISHGQATPEGEWYDQDRDEWVILLSGDAVLGFDDGTSVPLSAGDHLLLPAHRRHRVDYTSTRPGCTWLAVHADLSKQL